MKRNVLSEKEEVLLKYLHEELIRRSTKQYEPVLVDKEYVADVGSFFGMSEKDNACAGDICLEIKRVKNLINNKIVESEKTKTRLQLDLTRLNAIYTAINCYRGRRQTSDTENEDNNTDGSNMPCDCE